jgi:solute carrier family 35 (UDP-sugar transporter), member A1/2/3
MKAHAIPPLLKYISWKWISLILFVIEDALLIIILRYESVYIEDAGAVADYISTTVVFFTEHLKMILSIILFFIFDCGGSLWKAAELIVKGLMSDDSTGDALKLCVPALLYTIQNTLQYTIESSPLFLVVYQLKVITTALFYSTLLGRRISMKEWFAIILLAIGVGMVQSSQREFRANHASNIIGIISVGFACLTSGQRYSQRLCLRCSSHQSFLSQDSREFTSNRL